MVASEKPDCNETTCGRASGPKTPNLAN